MECEIINIEDEQLRTKKEYEGRLILIKRNATEEEPEVNWLKCSGCNVLHPLTDYEIDLTNGLTLTPDFQCKVVSCGITIKIENGETVK